MSKQSEYITEAIFQAAVTLQWQASDATEDGNGYPISEGGDDHTDAVASIPWLVEAVTSFIKDEEVWKLLEIAGSDASQTGHDFILTANGHGTGFWDRGYDMPVWDEARETYDRVGRSAYRAYVAGLELAAVGPIARYLANVGDALSDACKPYGEFDAEFALDEDGDVVYLSAINGELIFGEYPETEDGE